MSEQTCKGCGLGVQSGYPKCPRCHMPLPVARPSTQAELAGGTAVETDSGRASLWIGGGVMVAIVIGILVIQGGDKEASSEEEPTTAAVLEPPAPIAQPALSPVGVNTELPGPDFETKRLALLRALEAELNGLRLWATVRMDDASDSTVSVVSGACEDEAMKPAILEHGAELRDSGISAIYCRAKHGALVFEQSL